MAQVITIQLPGSPGPAGPQGVPGPGNSVSIGTVTTVDAGLPAEATMTGTSPNQVLNLVVPKGDTGPQGESPTLAMGTVSTGVAGSDVIGTITGTHPAYFLNLTIPRGSTGLTGPATTLAIGTVTPGANETDASATLTGTAPNQTLNLVLPRGLQGATGPAGPAGPEGPQGPQGIPGTAGGAGTGVPTGGTTGQVLNKLSGTDFDTGWVSAVSAGTANTVMKRDASGRAQVANPSAATDIANKQHVDSAIATALAGFSGGGAVDSVNGQTGVVVLTNTDVGAAATSHSHPISQITATGSASSTTFLRGDGTWSVPPGGTAGGDSGMPFIIVAGSNASTATKGIADYVCDGTADQTEINLAITAAFNSAGGGPGTVLLNGRFNISGSILMRHGIVLAGSGLNTMITAVSMGSVGMIQLFDFNTGLTQVRDLTLWGNFAAGGTSHGIYYINSSGGVDGNISTYSPGNNPDPSHRIDNVYIKAFTTGTRHGIFLDDNCRDTNIQRARIFDCSGNGLYLNGASDGKFQQVIASNCNVGFNVAGASNQFTQCKSAFADTDGWVISSSRAHLTGCHSQDSGRWGYNVTGATPTLSSCVADSNQRLDNTGGGFLLNSSGLYSDLDAYDRNQSTQRQTRCVSFGTSIGTSYITGKTSVPSGTNYVVGTTPAAASYVRIVRVGSTLYSVG